MCTIARTMTYDPSDMRSDSQLLELSRKGDRNAFGQLVGKYYRNYVRIAACILRDPTEAEDGVQQALFKAFIHLDQYLEEAEFYAWVLRIVVNECRMLMRSKKRTYFCQFETRDNWPIELPAITSDPEHQTIRMDMVKLLRIEIRRIPPLLRQVILLRDIDQLSMPDVANRLGITVPAAKSRLLRARGELRKRVLCRFGPARHMIPVAAGEVLPARPVGFSSKPACIC